MHQNRFRLGLCPRPRWGSLRRSPRPPSRLGGDRRLGRLHSRAFGTRLGFAVPSLCPWRRLCVYCVNCTKFGQLILRIIIKIDATRCQIFRLKCTKIVFGWGSAPDPAGGAYSAPPDPRSWIKGSILLREGEGIWEGRGRGGKGGKDRGGGRGGTGREGTPPPIFYCTPVLVF